MNIPSDFSLKPFRKIIEGDFPHLAAEKIIFLDESWDNIVVEVNQEYIFRFPKDTDVPFFLELEVLKKLQGKTTLEIPRIEFVGKSFSYSGYRKIEGEHMTRSLFSGLTNQEKEKFISDLTRFLVEIHSAYPVEEWRKLGVEEEDERSYVDLAETLFTTSFQDKQVLSIVRSVIEAYKGMIQEKDEAVFLYNDLHTENMAFDAQSKKLRGIYDFGDVAVGDINRDFSHLYKFEPSVMTAVMQKYGNLTGQKLSKKRAILYAAMNEVCDLAELHDRPESSVYKNAVERLTQWKPAIVTYLAT